MLWTRTELAVFAEYMNLDEAAMMMAYSCISGVTVGSKQYQDIQAIGEELGVLRKKLKELMGTTRYIKLVEGGFGPYNRKDWSDYKKWQNELTVRYCRKHRIDPEHILGHDLEYYV